MQWYQWLTTSIGSYMISGVTLALVDLQRQKGSPYPLTILDFLGVTFIGPFLLVCFYALSGMDWLNWRL